MNLDSNDARKRQKLSLPFGGRQSAGARPAKCGAAEISDRELRRLVASMID